jgi:iron(III) transport system substrate-binding protein
MSGLLKESKMPFELSGNTLRKYCAALIACICIALPALSLGANSEGDRTLTLYAGQHQQMVRMLVKAFEKKTGIDVKVRYGDGIELANQIGREGKKTPADVFMAENSPVLIHLQNKGLLAPIAKKTLAQIPSQYNSAQGLWIGVLARENVLTYNPDLVNKSELPESVLGLADPKWQGKVGIHLTSADIMPLIKIIKIQDGRGQALQWLKGIKRNAKLYQHSSGTVLAVNNGDVAMGISNSYYYYRLREQIGRDKMVSKIYHFKDGDPGNMVNVSGAAALKYAPHPKAAQKLVAFMVSAKAQKMLAESTVDFEYPLRPGVAANPQLKPLDELEPPQVSAGKLGTNRESLELLQAVGLL